MSAFKNKKLGIFILLLVPVVTASVWRSGFFSNTDRIKPKVGDVIESIYGLGTVTADKTYHVRAGTALSIEKLYVKEGDLVNPGDALVNLEGSVLRSHINGTVTAISYKDGELVTPQVSILTVTNLDHLILEVSLEQQSILRVKKDQLAFVSFESLRNEKYEGVVASVYPRESQFIVRIQLKSWPSGVLPGMTADVAILVGKKSNVLLIPIGSIVGGQVTRLRTGKKERVPVKLGVIDGEWGEVTSGNISQEDELIIRK